MSRFQHIKPYTHLLLLLLLAVACAPNTEEKPTEGILLEVKGVQLTAKELQREVPKGLSPADSTRFAHSFMRQWITDVLLYENAKNNITNTTSIEARVEQYRRELVNFEYQNNLVHEKISNEISDSTLLNYYEEHKAHFVLRHNIIRGLFIKVPSDAPLLKQLKEWYKSDKPEAIEEIEKNTLENAFIYEYFYDKWIDLDQVMENIPFPLVSQAQFLREKKQLEIEEDGYWYLLNISDYLTVGNTTPFEYAKPQIEEIIMNQRRKEFLNEMGLELYHQAKERGEIHYYFPIERQNDTLQTNR